MQTSDSDIYSIVCSNLSSPLICGVNSTCSANYRQVMKSLVLSVSLTKFIPNIVNRFLESFILNISIILIILGSGIILSFVCKKRFFFNKNDKLIASTCQDDSESKSELPGINSNIRSEKIKPPEILQLDKIIEDQQCGFIKKLSIFDPIEMDSSAINMKRFTSLHAGIIQSLGANSNIKIPTQIYPESAKVSRLMIPKAKGWKINLNLPQIKIEYHKPRSKSFNHSTASVSAYQQYFSSHQVAHENEHKDFNDKFFFDHFVQLNLPKNEHKNLPHQNSLSLIRQAANDASGRNNVFQNSNPIENASKYFQRILNK